MILVLFGGNDEIRGKLAREVAQRSRTFYIPSAAMLAAGTEAGRTAMAVALGNAILGKDVLVELPSSSMFSDKDRYDIIMGDLEGVLPDDDDASVSVAFACMPGEQPDDAFGAIRIADGAIEENGITSVALNIIARADLLAVH